MPARLATQVGFLDRHPEIALAASLSEEVRDDGRATGKVKRRPIFPDDMRVHALFRCPVLQSTVMARRETLAAFPYGLDSRVSSDYPVFGRLCWAHSTVTLPEVLVHRRVHGGSISRVKFHLTRDRNRLTIRERLDAIGMAYTDVDIDNQYAIGHLNKQDVDADPALLPWARRWFPELRRAVVAAGIAPAAIDVMLGACARSGRWSALAAPPYPAMLGAAVREFAVWRCTRDPLDYLERALQTRK